MRLFGVVLAIMLVWTQGVLWFDRDAGLREVWKRESRLAESLQRNEMKSARNAALAAEVQDLIDGHAAMEERARYDLGMIGKDEVFVQLNLPAQGRPLVPSPNGLRPAGPPGPPVDTARLD